MGQRMALISIFEMLRGVANMLLFEKLCGLRLAGWEQAFQLRLKLFRCVV